MTTSSEVLTHWKEAAELAAKRIPPLWPLKHFVAVNPFLEMVDQPFSQVAGKMARMVPGGMLVERSFYQKKFEADEVTEAHLEQALAQLTTLGQLSSSEPVPTIDELKTWLTVTCKKCEFATLARVIDDLHGSLWESEVVDEISNWLGAYLDEGQAIWKMPWKQQHLFQAWREAASIDCNPEILGLEKFRSFVAELPEDPLEAVLSELSEAELPLEDVTDWLHSTLLSVGGWASCLQYRNREGQSEDGPMDLLAIRLAFDVALLKQYDSPELRSRLTEQAQGWDEDAERDLQLHLVWQEAFELAYREQLLTSLPSVTGQSFVGKDRPFAQMVFCIDVRSEPMRRAIEASHAGIATYGYAGFFGMPVEKVPFTKTSGAPHCPVILQPPFRVREGADQNEKELLTEKKRQRGLAGMVKSFKDSAVSCFSFVEASGLKYAWTLAKDTFVHDQALPKESSLKPKADATTGVSTIEPVKDLGIPHQEQVALATGVVNALNLNQKAGRLVVLCGHGASTTNNPYDSGYQCGACGGHSGDFNARLAADLMNRSAVREGLKEAGVGIPDDTVFVAGRHDTTLDIILLFDQASVPESHQEDLETLKQHLEISSKKARLNRASKLGLEGSSEKEIHADIIARSGDWSQVRPEWGLAGNASFIVAPRESTAKLDLDGRAFLHHYQTEHDPEGGLLAAILGGPMVVGSWINLQYYASSANQEVFGSGHKTLHNVNGTHGVQLGNGGDLKTGLAFQSVHDGEKLMHEPSRLHVFVDAEEAKVRKVVEGNATVKDLIQNRWVHIFASDGQGGWSSVCS